MINRFMKEIKHLLDLGRTNAEIQQELGFSSYKVSYWRAKLGYDRSTTRPDYDWIAIQADHNSGMSERQLQKKYGMSSKTIWTAKKQGKLTSRVLPPKKSKEEVQAKKNEANARYRAKLKEQTPADADIKGMQQFYMNCPEGYEVDHIIPISKGGLHTLSNLQYLTISENRKKSNKI